MLRRISPLKYGLALILATLFILAVSVAAFGLKPFTLREYVTDQAGILSAETRYQLANLLSEYAKQTTNQILVVTVPGLEGEDYIDFTESLFQLNKPGQKGKDNGIIMMVALQDRKIRIEVGYGLEGQVPDGKAGTIYREVITPYFKAGDYNSGITAGVYALIKAITPDYTLPTGQISEIPVRRKARGFSWPVLIFAGIFVLISMLGNSRNNRRFRRGYSEPWFWGGGGGGFSGGSGGDSGFSGGGGSFGGGGAGGSW